ncbi:MAG: aminotransferase class V-fold PLP-dependent enzyme [Candidatus Acidiferrales bacterium]
MGVKLPVYMDNHATTRVDPRVLDAILPYFGVNASSENSSKSSAESGVARARAQVAQLVNSTEPEILFTSGATESNNLAIKGIAGFYQNKGNHIITQVTEHSAVLDACRRLQHDGYDLTYLPVDKDGLINVNELRGAITATTILITIMYANNEIGVVQPIAEIGKIAKDAGVYFHVDGVQAVGKIPVDVEKDGIDLLSISAHKIYGPKGVGALYVRHRNPQVKLLPMIHGGGQELGIRGGTLIVPGIVGLGKACDICRLEMSTESARLRELRDLLKYGIMKRLDKTFVNGSMSHRLPHNLNISFALDGQGLRIGIKGVAVSSGSACASQENAPSHVLKAIGVTDNLARTTLRFGLGRFNTVEEVEYVTRRVVDTIERLRDFSPLYGILPWRTVATGIGRLLRCVESTIRRR